MKRSIFLICIIIMIFSFSSCEIADWFLGVVYPSGDKNIILNLGKDPFDMNAHPIIIALIPMLTDPATGQWNIDPAKIVQEQFWNANEMDQIKWEFRGLGNNAYQVIAYYDLNGNGTINADESSVNFTVDGNPGETIFNFTKPESPPDLQGGAYLSFGSRIDPSLYAKLSGDNTGGTQYDLTVKLDTVLFGNGYCDLYLRDYTNGNDLMYNWCYIDSVGDGVANFWGIIDPAGADQKIVAVFYDTTTWAWLGEVTVDLTGPLSGQQEVTVYYWP